MYLLIYFAPPGFTDLKMLHQEEDVVAVHQALTLSLQQQGHGVVPVRQHHNNWKGEGHGVFLMSSFKFKITR